MLTAIGMIAIFLAVIALPAEHPTWFAPHRRWSENSEFIYGRFFSFVGKRKALLCVFGSVAVTYLIVPAFEIGLVSKEQGAWTLVFASLICAGGSISLLWGEYNLRTKLAGYTRGFELVFATITFLMLVLGKSIAENEIQLSTNANPEEFSTASHALAALYALWFWVVLSSVVMAALAFFPLLFSFRQARPWSWEKLKKTVVTAQKWPRRKTAFESIEHLAILLGFFYSALTFSGISGSNWALERIKAATTLIIVKTSFFEPNMHTMPCMHDGFSLVRVIGDGDRVILTNGTDFESFKCDIASLENRQLRSAKEHRK
jgi:hypothetical protein